MPMYKSHRLRVLLISGSFPDEVVEPGHSVTAEPPPVVVARLLGRFRNSQVLGGGGVAVGGEGGSLGARGVRGYLSL